MSRLKKLLMGAAIIIIIAAIITGIYFLTRKSYTYSVRYEQEISNSLEAYNVVNEHIQDKSPGAKIVAYGLTMVGQQEITEQRPSEYGFQFDYSPTGDYQEAPIDRFFVTVKVDEKRIYIKHYIKTVPLGAVIPYEYPVEAIDIDQIYRCLEKKEEYNTIQKWIEDEPDTSIKIFNMLKHINYDFKNNSWDVTVNSNYEEINIIVELD